MAGVPIEIQQWIDRKYPRPRIDREWLQGCYEWAAEKRGPAYSQPLLDVMEDQLLKSSLADSMVPDTGLPGDIYDIKKTVTLSGTPTLVEIVSLTEIGSSAFQLDQVRKSREERIRAGHDEYGEGDEDADLEVEGEGPLPKYPRSMLSFVLTDGQTSFKAFEYKPLTELSLVNTLLGFKLQLKNVRVVCGVAHLEPNSVILLGGMSDANNSKDYYFRQDLRRRMGLPLEPSPPEDETIDDENGGPPPPPPPAAANIRPPLREISPPPSPPLNTHRNDDEDVEPRRRRIPNASSTLLPVVSRNNLAAASPYFPQNTNIPSSSPTLRQAAPNLAASCSFEPDFDFDMFDEIDIIESHRPPPVASSSRPRTQPPMSQQSHTFTLDDATKPSVFPRIFSAAPTLHGKLPLTPEFAKELSTRPAQAYTNNSDDLYDGMDDDFILGSEDYEMIETAEREALASQAPIPAAAFSALTRSTPPSSSPSSSKPPPTKPPQRTTPPEIISIDSDSDDGMRVVEDKENLPVERRHVRRRFIGEENGARDGGETLSQRAGSASQPNRPRVLASKPEDILEISDSD